MQKSEGLVQESLEVSKFIEDFKNEFANIIIKSNTRIISDLRVKKIIFSRKNFRSIIYNLLDNAVKYRSSQRDPVIRVRTEVENGWIVLSVSDNGLGFDIGKKDKVFGMFKRLHANVDGSGVGLYIVKRIIENAGRKIEVKISEIDKDPFLKSILSWLNNFSFLQNHIYIPSHNLSILCLNFFTL